MGIEWFLSFTNGHGQTDISMKKELVFQFCGFSPELVYYTIGGPFGKKV
jgi:hypothetical protein